MFRGFAATEQVKLADGSSSSGNWRTALLRGWRVNGRSEEEINYRGLGLFDV
jgi:hypothetical protein